MQLNFPHTQHAPVDSNVDKVIQEVPCTLQKSARISVTNVFNLFWVFGKGEKRDFQIRVPEKEWDETLVDNSLAT